MKDRYSYVLNAILYIVYLGNVKFDNFIGAIVYFPFYLFKFCLPKRISHIYIKRISKGNEEYSKLIKNPKNGSCMDCSESIFGLLYANYTFIPLGLIIGLLVKQYGVLHPIIYMPIIIIMIAITWQPVRRKVFKDYRYLKYFKKFEKEDKQWHRKWMWRTAAFCLGSLLSVAFGIYLCFACAIGRFDLWNLMTRG